MINKLYDNCFTTELQTQVKEVKKSADGFWHACNDTIFFQGDDQMRADIGVINKKNVKALRFENGMIWHLLDTQLSGNVFMSVNLHERFRQCQIHTAQHLIEAILKNVYKGEMLQHHMGEDENSIEFSLKDFNSLKAFELQVLCNGLIRDDLAIIAQYPTAKEANALFKNVPYDTDMRVVRIGALSYSRCHCMHVPSLRYLQMIYIRGFNKSANGYDIKYVVGDQLLDAANRRYQVLDEVCEELHVEHPFLNTAINQLHHRLEASEKAKRDWIQKYYKSVTREWMQQKSTIIEETCDVKEHDLKQMAEKIFKKSEQTTILINKQYDRVQIVIYSASIDPKAMISQISQRFHLQTQFDECFAQATGIYDKEIKAYVKENLK